MMNFKFPEHVEEHQSRVQAMERDLDECRNQFTQERAETRQTHAQVIRETRRLSKSLEDSGVVLAVKRLGKAMSRDARSRGSSG